MTIFRVKLFVFLLLLIGGCHSNSFSDKDLEILQRVTDDMVLINSIEKEKLNKEITRAYKTGYYMGRTNKDDDAYKALRIYNINDSIDCLLSNNSILNDSSRLYYQIRKYFDEILSYDHLSDKETKAFLNTSLSEFFAPNTPSDLKELNKDLLKHFLHSHSTRITQDIETGPIGGYRGFKLYENKLLISRNPIADSIYIRVYDDAHGPVYIPKIKTGNTAFEFNDIEWLNKIPLNKNIDGDILIEYIGIDGVAKTKRIRSYPDEVLNLN